MIKYVIKKCNSCSLILGINKIVGGEGAPNSIMIIGEAPGYTEDRLGMPFVGKSGVLLALMLEKCNFTRDEHVFITNIIKCRPPGNRKPTIRECSICSELHLRKEIDHVKPKLFLLLGNVALSTFTNYNYTSITKYRGKWLGKDKNVLATYHPRYIISNPGLLNQYIYDFMMLVRKYQDIIDNTHTSKI